MQNLSFDFSFVAPAPPERVFPLLCPVRERDWVPGWECEVVHSATGFACLDCVFTTPLPETGRLTWVVSRYEPPRRIEFTCFAPGLFVMRLDVALSAHGTDLCRLDWSRRFFALGPEGSRALQARTPEVLGQQMARLEAALAHHLAAPPG